MSRHDTVVIGASAGGLQALTTLVGRLPPSLEACVLVVMHSASDGTGVLPDILARISALPVAFAAHGDVLKRGQIYIAPPDFHLIVTAGGLAAVHGPRENGFRPAIDPLFRTAARELGPRVIGVVLSGALSDGTYGLSVIKHCGGITVVQDPQDAIIPSMPMSALKYVDIDHVLPAGEIAELIERLTAREGGKGVPAMPGPKEELEPQLASENTEVAEMKELFGPPSALTCPDCGGALWEVQEGRVVRYQCHVGHQYAPENLEGEQRDAIDSALWSAVRALEEHAELKMRMARRAAESGLGVVSEGFAAGAREAHEQAQRIKSVLFSSTPGQPGVAGEAAQRRTSSAEAVARRAKARVGRQRRSRRKGRS